MIPGVIRPLALAIIKNKEKLLVMNHRNSQKNQIFYRPLGGGIEFGEQGQDALKREFREELNAELKNIQFITTMENIFTYNGKQGHEIVLLYQAEFVDQKEYDKESMPILDSKSGTMASWQNISDFREDQLILYPENILNFIKD